MTQQDFTNFNRAQRARSNKRKKLGYPVHPVLFFLTIGSVLLFISVLYFLTQHAPSSHKPIRKRLTLDSSLPPKPEERWRYIKELENRQIRIPPTTTEPQSPDKSQLIPEQLQLLKQTQIDKNKQPIHLPEVPYNALPSEIIKNGKTQQNDYSPKNNMLTNESNFTKSPANHLPENTLTVEQKNSMNHVTSVGNQPIDARKQKWKIECGPFQTSEQAESLRAQLAFIGIESQLKKANNFFWISLGSYNSKKNVDDMVKQFQNEKISNCNASVLKK